MLAQLRKIRHFPGLRNDCDLEIFIRQAGNGQTNSINRNRPLEDQVARQLARIGNSYSPRAALLSGTQKFSAPIDVALNDMAAQTRCRSYGAFQIYGRARAKSSQSRSV